MCLSIKDPLTVSMSTIIRNVSVNIVRLRECFIMKKFVYPLEHICVPQKRGTCAMIWEPLLSIMLLY